MIHTTEEKSDELEQLVQDLHSKDRSIRTNAGMKLDARARFLAEFQEPLRRLALTISR